MQVDVRIFPIASNYCIIKVLEHNTIKEPLLNLISEVEQQSQNSTITKVDWANSTSFDREWISFIKPTLDTYNTIVGQAIGYEQPTITDLWFQQYEQNSYHDWHIHREQMVGVYFLELPEDSPQTELVPPFLHDIKIKSDVKEGDILIFPSNIVHKAPVILNSKRKTILSWNFHFEQPNKNLMERLNKL